MATHTSQQDLHESFLFDAWDALRSFEAAAQALSASPGKLNIDALKDLRVISHRLKGAAALYDYTQVAKLADLSERLLSFAERIPEESVPQLQEFLGRVSVCLNTTLERISTGRGEGQLGLELSYLGAAALFRDLVRANPATFLADEHQAAPVAAEPLDFTASLQGFAAQHPEVWGFFAPEAQEHLDAMSDALQAAEYESSEAQLGDLFRATHTLKGAAYMVEFGAVGALAHRLETLMVAVREEGKPFDEKVQRALQAGITALSLMLRSAEGEKVELETAVRRVEGQLEELLGTAPSLLPDAEPSTPELSRSLRAFYRAQPDVWSYFPQEVRAQLTALREALALAEDAKEDALADLSRAAHTLKGAADAVAFPHLSGLAALLESIVEELRDEDLPVREAAPLFEEGAAVIEQLLRAAEGRETPLLTTLPAFHEHVASWLGKADVRRDRGHVNTLRVRLDTLDGLLDVAGELVNARSRLGYSLERFSELRALFESSRLRLAQTADDFEAKYLNPSLSTSPELTQAAVQEDVQRSPVGLSEQGLTRRFEALEFDSYSDLNILARSVAEMASDLSEVQTQFERVERVLLEEYETVQTLTRTLRGELSSARRVPLATLFRRLRHLVKPDAAKAYRLELSGETVEVDALILEALTDPLSHLIRNAIVHGIEDRETRLAADKPAEGVVSVRAYYDANRVYIDVADDGAGIDVDAVKRQALARKLKSPEELESMPEGAALNLIFLPGLSTAQALTTEAGRGVGMDIVATNMKRLKGEVSLSTEAGQGTRFRLGFPLTQIVSEALLIRSGAQTLAFPADAILTLRTLPSQLLPAPTQKQKRELVLEDGAAEFYSLRELFGLPQLEQTEVDMVLVSVGGKQIAFGVDQFLSIEDVVIKGLGDALEGLSYLAGAALASTGEVIPILDPRGLYELAHQEAVPTRREPEAQAPSANHILLVDDSVSVRKIVAKMLRRAGFEVTTANDGQEALEQLRKVKVDALITDLEMPRLNGYELTEIVRHKAQTADLPVFVMTTRAGDKHMNLALELGATNYLIKPVDESKLLGLLDKTLKQGSATSNKPKSYGSES